MKCNLLFNDYLNNINIYNIHPEMIELNKQFPNNINELSNIIIYGKKGIGKYSQLLYLISKYGDYNLKYEKKILIENNKNKFYIKISDIHYEVDMRLLGCKATTIWNNIYNVIYDSIISKNKKVGFIVCKNFHCIANDELIDIFYNYMQLMFNSNVCIKFILITEHITFLPNNIINCCNIIRLSKPLKKNYNNINNTKIKLNKITNISDVQYNQININNDKICNEILLIIYNFNNPIFFKEKSVNKYIDLRNKIYDILIYNLDTYECLWIIINDIIKKYNFKDNDMKELLDKIEIFSKYYNNNYRPIYHLESIIIYLIIKINEYL